MKKLILVSVFSVFVSLMFFACSSSPKSSPSMEQKSEKTTVYTCPMHPEVTSDKEGTCPKCGMTLVKKEPQADSAL